MNRLLVLSFFLLAFALPGAARSPQNSKPTAEQTTTGSRTSASSSKKTEHITGCLEKQNGEYVLKEKNGKVANVTSTLDLASQVGHEVTAAGSWQPHTTPNANKSEATDNPNQLLVIGHMKILSNTCK